MKADVAQVTPARIGRHGGLKTVRCVTPLTVTECNHPETIAA